MDKEFWKVLWIKVKAWCLAFLSNMWEDCIKEYLKQEIHGIIVQAAQTLIAYRHSEIYEDKRDEILGHLIDKIKLPVLLKPFRWLIKSIIISSIQKEIDKKLEVLESKL